MQKKGAILYKKKIFTNLGSSICVRWFCRGTPASSTTKTGRHDIVEILLKVTLNTKNQIKYEQIKLISRK
jgi:hypothetical protein